MVLGWLQSSAGNCIALLRRVKLLLQMGQPASLRQQITRGAVALKQGHVLTQGLPWRPSLLLRLEERKRRN